MPRVRSKTGASGTSTPVVPAWADATAYALGALVSSGGQVYRATTAHTSSGSIDLTKFTAVAGTSVALTPTAVKTSAYTAAVGDLVPANVTSAGFTVTLPTNPATGAVVGIYKYDASGNTLTIAPAGGGTIDGDANATTVTKNAGATFEHLGSNAWKIVSSYLTTGPAGPTGPSGPTGATGATGPTGAAGAIAQVQDEGTNVTVRGTLNFVGAGVTAADDAANSRTNITIAAAAGVPLAGSVVGWYYMTQSAGGGAVNASTTTLNQLQYVPIWLEAGTLDRLAQQILSGTPTAAETVRLGLYADNGRGYPGTLVVDGGTVDLGTSGIRTITVSTVITRGLYWTALVRQGTGVTVGLLEYRPAANSGPGPLGMAMTSMGANLFDSTRALTQSAVTGALPGTAAPNGIREFVAPAYVRYGA